MDAEEARPLPRRGTDRIELAAVVVLSVAGLLGALAIIVLALSNYGAGLARAEQEAAERTQVEATVLADAPPLSPAATRGVAPTSRVPARWTAPDGTPRTGTVQVPGRPAAGEVELVWVDRSGATAPAPAGRGSVLGGAVLGAAVLLGLLVGVLVGVRRLLAAVLLRANAATWGREWAEVEPRWSGRTSTG
ncbi:hypothetical protein ACL02T_08895 [Pseudonocardia sp. RS010]|uniref:Rv1733c family protein n=1 Tax=Pseudonocardia sp. RS010 TaxID=3385979 RepID=UPI0039A02834